MACCDTSGTEGCNLPPSSSIVDDVKQYYGKTLKTSDDLQTTACTTPVLGMHKHVRKALGLVHDEVISKYYGCGLVIPDCIEGMQVLDLGSGSGRDCFAVAKLVGKLGYVTGIDMTDEQLEVANKYVDYHKDLFGYSKANTKFVKGYIEDLQSAGIKDESVDVIISNCVINLCKDKRAVLKEAYRVLNFGGELFFSDVYADRELSDEIRQHKVLWGECVSGALHWKSLFDLAEEIGFETPRTFSVSPFNITKPDLKKVVGEAKFASITYRLFKLKKDKISEKSEVMYNGETIGCETELKFDRDLTFTVDEPVVLDSITSAMIQQSRLFEEFTIRKAPCCAKGHQVCITDPFNLDLTASEKQSSCGDNSQCC